MRERLPKLVAALAVALGVAAVLAGLSVFVEAWQASRAWAGSAEAEHATVPSEAPIWLDDADGVPAQPRLQDGQPGADPRNSGVVRPTPPRADAAEPTPSQADAAPAPVVSPESSVAAQHPGPTHDFGEADVAPGPVGSAATTVPAAAIVPTAVPAAAVAPTAAPPMALAAPADIEVTDVDFRFLDPPEPGAHARLALNVLNRASVPTGPVSVVVSARWLQEFAVFGAIPDVLEDRPHDEGERWFVFGGLGPSERQTLELHVLATGEEVEAPEVRVVLGDGGEIGRARPRTVAPRPRPGPARAVTIPKLGVRASVVPVTWEPPAFVIGQLNGTASVSEGNTVLVGHLAGPAGDVFARLDRLRPGDEVVAMSRGLEYRFVVSEIAVKPYDDVGPTQPTQTPRLTLMTCTGQWSILRQDYSHRLWVVAEPPDLAQQTIRANAERAAQSAREAEVAAAARATHEAEVVQDAATPTPQDSEVTRTLVPTVPAAPVLAPAVPVAAPPVPVAAATPSRAPDEAEDLAPGILIDTPGENSAVGRRVTVRGRRAAEADPRGPLWLLVRAEVPGSRWYALDRPLEPNNVGAWQIDVELGGVPGIRHEIRVGVADETADRVLRRHANERAGQPLDDLPVGFKTGARVTVERR